MTAARTFDRMAPIYEKLVNVYSFGCIPRAKRAQLPHIEPGSRVLYAGVGPGDDAAHAARRGAVVTAVDLSATMLAVTQRRFESAGHDVRLVHADIFDYEPAEPFDIVVANFFVDCFSEGRQPAVVEQLVGFLRPGGKLLIADTGIPRGSLLARGTWYVYQGIAYAVTWAQGLTPWLPLCDLRAHVTAAGCRIVEHSFHRPWPRGPVLFEHMVAVNAA